MLNPVASMGLGSHRNVLNSGRSCSAKSLRVKRSARSYAVWSSQPPKNGIGVGGLKVEDQVCRPQLHRLDQSTRER